MEITQPTSDSGVDSINGLTGDVILAAGSNITLGTVGNTITINATNQSPSIGGTITGGTANSVLFVNPTGIIAQDNTNLNFNNTTKLLTIGGHVLVEGVTSTGATGTGKFVFDTTPTFTTNITSPLVIGGTAVGSSLSLQSTSGVGTTDFINFLVGNNGATEAARFTDAGLFGINNTSPVGTIDIIGHNAASSSGTSGLTAELFFNGTGGTGGTTTSAGANITGGSGGGFTLTTGTGGLAPNATNIATGGSGGAFTVLSGNGSQSGNSTATSARGGAGGQMTFSAGTGANPLFTLGSVTNTTGGNGGAFQFGSGNGGNATAASPGNNTGGTAGAVNIFGGTGGNAGNASGNNTAGAGGALLFLGGNGGNGVTGGNGGAMTLGAGNSGTAATAVGGITTVQAGTGTLRGGTILFKTAVTTSLATKATMYPDGSLEIGAGTTTLGKSRLGLTGGTAVATTDWALTAGWGAGATISAVTGNDSRGTVTVTTSIADTPALNPTITLTFKDGTWTSAPFAVANMNTASTGLLGAASSSTTATTLVIQFDGTPTALSANTYIFNYIVIK